VRQELNMSLFEKAEMHQVLFVTRMAVMGFVRATCSRGGSVCKDWFDRAGKMVYWLTRNVLSVSDFVWAKEGMELELPDGSTEVDPLRGEVKLNRVKVHYHEAGYEYDMSVTADAVQAARRASWWIFLYQFCRGLFKVQYAEMSQKAIDKGWSDPKQKIAFMNAARDLRSPLINDRIRVALSDPDKVVAKAAKDAAGRLDRKSVV
jgi:hypothetical protein